MKSLKLFASLLLIGLVLVSVVACGGAKEPQIEVEGAWARSSPKMAGAGAAYMMLKNSGGEADKLLSGKTDAAAVVELHESVMDDKGVMKMQPVEGGVIEVPAKGSAELKPGGLHIMLIKLTEPLEVGKELSLTLNFEKSGEMVITVPVLEQPPAN